VLARLQRCDGGWIPLDLSAQVGRKFADKSMITNGLRVISRGGEAG
jgi:hypothetical protein